MLAFYRNKTINNIHVHVHVLYITIITLLLAIHLFAATVTAVYGTLHLSSLPPNPPPIQIKVEKRLINQTSIPIFEWKTTGQDIMKIMFYKS